MSMDLVAGIDFPKQLPTATASYFLLGLNAAGLWVIRETTGRKAGLFRTREAAIKYARDESPMGLPQLGLPMSATGYVHRSSAGKS